MIPDQRRQFLDLQRQFQEYLQLSTASSRPPATVSSTLPIEALQFDSTSPLPLRPSPVHVSVDSTVPTSLAASVALQMDSTVISTEATVSSAPATSAAPSPSPTERATSTSSDDDDDVGHYITVPSTTHPTQSSPPQD